MPRPDARVGTELGGYRIEALLGRGGMGVVYRALHLALERPVALKLLASDLADDESFRARFIRESRLAAAIDHPNIIPIYEAGEAEGEFFLAMRYVEGTDLEKRLKAGPLEPAEAVRVLAQVASALDAAHARGLVHRDVKPGNILLASGQGAEEADHVYLTDFGLTKHASSKTGLTRSGTFIGSLDYIAPEQIEGSDVDGRADVYSLGCMAYHCLTGEPPFRKANDVAIINAHLREKPPAVSARRPEVPAAADRVLARAMAKKPAERYPTARAFTTALRDALGVRITETRPIPTITGRLGGPERWPLLAAAAVGVLLIGAVGLAFALRGAAPTASAPATTLAASPPSVSGSPTAEPFPNTAERRLMQRLPPTIGRDCQRINGRSGDPASGLFTAQMSETNLRCAPTASNPEAVRVYEFRNVDTRLGSPKTVLFWEGGNRGIFQSGACATDERALQEWRTGGERAGYLLCYVEKGKANLWWTHDASRILIWAVARDADRKALWEWWLRTGPFLGL